MADMTRSNNGSSEMDVRSRNGDAGRDVVARAPVGRDELYYNMFHPERGMGIIFNHEEFLNKNLETRTGSKIDCASLEETLKYLGFSVTVHKNATLERIKSCISDVANMDHSSYDCFFMAVLTHKKPGRLHAYDEDYKPEMLWQNFTADKCPTLAGKPKLFFIQACYPETETKTGRHTEKRKLTVGTETDDIQTNEYRIPIQADFLIAYSTIPGCYSWANTKSGSWFIGAVVEILRDHAFDYDLLTLLMLVNQKVALNYESYVPTRQRSSCFTSMLYRFLMFNKK